MVFISMRPGSALDERRPGPFQASKQVESKSTMDALLLSADDASKLIGVGRSHFYSMHSSGRLGPIPVKLGKRSLWDRRELELWVQAKCPPREDWQNRGMTS